MLYVVRHGQTDWNLLHKIQGQVDISLNDEGILQAQKLKEKLKSIPIDFILSSPLLRSKQTAQIIAHDEIPIHYDERILERDFGEFEGLSKDDFDTNVFWNYAKNQQYEKAESIQNFCKRIYHFLDEYKPIYETKNILLVTHSGVLPVIHCYFNGIPNDNYIFTTHLENCDFLTFEK